MSLFGPRIRIDRELYEKAKACAELAGYASVEELVRHALEKQIGQLEDAASPQQVRERLRGLGYIS